MTVARDAGSCFIARHLASFVTRPCQRGIEFAADQLFDELTPPEPLLRSRSGRTSCRKDQHLSRRLHGIRLRGKLGHGVVSSPTLQRGRFEVDHPGDYANPNSYHPATAPPPARTYLPYWNAQSDNFDWYRSCRSKIRPSNKRLVLTAGCPLRSLQSPSGYSNPCARYSSAQAVAWPCGKWRRSTKTTLEQTASPDRKLSILKCKTRNSMREQRRIS
jgi:hypothetical protein